LSEECKYYIDFSGINGVKITLTRLFNLYKLNINILWKICFWGFS